MFTTVVVLLCITLVSAAPKIPHTGRFSDQDRENLRSRLSKRGGCNANVCFAIDGSGSINSTQFLAEKNFVLDVSSVITVDDKAELTAVQFAKSAMAISPLTDDIASFNLAVQDTRQMGGRSKVMGGINYCFSRLASRRKEAIKLVLLSDGRSNIGRSAVSRANHFRGFGGDVSVVAAGFPDHSELLAIAGGKADHVFDVGDFFDVLALQDLIEALVEQVCSH